MEKTTQLFVEGTYCSKGGMGTDSPFELAINNPFYRFDVDGTYELLTQQYQKKGQWTLENNVLTIQIDGQKKYEFEYKSLGYQPNSSVFSFELTLNRSNGNAYSMIFTKDLRCKP